MTDQASYRFTPDQQAFYAENGFIHLRAMFSAGECASLREEFHELARRLGNPDAT